MKSFTGTHFVYVDINTYLHAFKDWPACPGRLNGIIDKFLHACLVEEGTDSRNFNSLRGESQTRRDLLIDFFVRVWSISMRLNTERDSSQFLEKTKRRYPLNIPLVIYRESTDLSNVWHPGWPISSRWVSGNTARVLTNFIAKSH